MPHRDGRRIAARWLTSDPVFGVFEKQRVIEEDAVARAQASGVSKTDVDISVVQNLSLLSKIYSDCILALVVTEDENELFMTEVVESMAACLDSVCLGNVNSTSLFDNLNQVFLMLDEIFDDGHVFETESEALSHRVTHSTPHKEEAQTFNSALFTARDSLIRSLMSG
ncbi:MAG: hypothetical protein KVP17_002155 [Porospora cf. gigantea B]|uniref:uncharacterized protein n=1 Tax=Porospora cf. gigantea B TaxID=2853592 RepID=UPI0035718E23|nr:MAG: hypothetical protein KVP17_002155 [Porospora cf. gigantea B]